MADREYRQISDLPTGITPITGAEIVELEQDGVSRKFSMVALSGVVAEHEDKHQFGGDDPVGTHDLVANAIPYLGADGTIDSRVSDASTTVKGKVQLSTDGGTDAGTVVQATDGRLTDARDPTEHASTHMPDDTDPIALATTSAPGLMGNGDKTKLDSIDTSLLLTTAQKGALTGSYGAPGPDNVFVTDTDPRIGGEGPDITDLVNWAAFTDVPWVEKHAGYTSLTGALRYIIEWDNHVFLLPTNGRLSWRDGSTVTEVTGQSADANWEGAAIFEGKLYVISSVSTTGGTLDEIEKDGDGYKLTSRITFGSSSPRSIGSFGGYLFVGNYDGTIIRYPSGLGSTTSISGISERIVELIECSGVFYAFTRSTVTGSIYAYDSGTESFSSLSLTKAWMGAFVENDTLYGLALSDDIYEFDPVTPALTAKNLTVRGRLSGCVTASGEVLVVASAIGSGFVVYELETVTTPSINISLSDVKVNLPSTLPIGSRKVIRKLGDDATKYITITPPAGTTIEGLAEYRLYEQYASVTLERVSETQFVFVDMTEQFPLDIEVATRNKWVDGKRIYRKAVNYGALPNNTTKDVNHNITGLERVVKILGSAYSPSGPVSFEIPYTNSVVTTAGNLIINVTGGAIRMVAGVNYSTFTAVVTLDYTKT